MPCRGRGPAAGSPPDVPYAPRPSLARRTSAATRAVVSCTCARERLAGGGGAVGICLDDGVRGQVLGAVPFAAGGRLAGGADIVGGDAADAHVPGAALW